MHVSDVALDKKWLQYAEYSKGIALMLALPDVIEYIVLFVNYFMNETNTIFSNRGDKKSHKFTNIFTVS